MVLCLISTIQVHDFTPWIFAL